MTCPPKKTAVLGLVFEVEQLPKRSINPKKLIKALIISKIQFFSAQRIEVDSKKDPLL